MATSRNYSEQIADGMDVYDTSGDKIGTVSEVYDATQRGGTSGSGGGYLRVPTGFLGLGREHHIPFSAIRSVEDDHIYLGVSRDELDNLGYDESPTAIEDDRDVPDQPTGTTQPVRSRDVVAEEVTPSDARQPAAADERRRLQLREEELIPRKRTVQTGEVRLETEVVEEQRTVEVPVTREEVYVERHAVDRRPAERPISEQGETITVPVSEDEVTVEKRAVVYEEVEVGKRAVQETESVDATVRREEVRVDDQGNLLEGAGSKSAAASQGTRGTTPRHRAPVVGPRRCPVTAAAGSSATAPAAAAGRT